MIDKNIIAIIASRIADEVTTIKPIAGGSINQTYKLQCSKAAYFIKIDNKSRFPGMFKAEADGLNLIAQTHAIKVPEPLFYDDAGDESFLLMEWIESRRPTQKASVALGYNLAMLHQNTASYFGLDTGNYMGSLPQSNRKHTQWADFYMEERLEPMVKLAADKRLLDSNDIGLFNRLYQNLPGLFTEEPPALIHGDLWGGNYLVSEDETPYLIDPAVTYGHREADMAMTTLFGGFADAFYGVYQETFSLAKGWQDRLDLWNLYPLLVHLNLFGSGYLGHLRDCLKRYV